MTHPPLLRSFWQRAFGNAFVCAILLFAVLNTLRFVAYFGADRLQSMPLMIGFVLMWFVPIVFLSRAGRRRIGLLRPRGNSWPIVAIGAGILAAAVCFGLGYALYGHGERNWFVSVGYSYQTSDQFALLPQKVAFIVFTIPAMLLSPIGEEFLFRGLIHQSARERWGTTVATVVNASLFAAVHLAHHGVLRIGDEIRVYWISGALWFLLMFATSVVFTWMRHLYDSIWTSVIAHSFFNLAMNYTIFYYLFVAH